MEMERRLHTETDTKKPGFALVIVIGVALFTVYGFIQQIVLGTPFGTNPAPDWAMYLLLALCGFGLPAFILSLRLRVRVTDTAVHVRLFPLPGRTIPLDEIESAEATGYRALREWGGWGLRYNFAGTAYTMSGSQGVRIGLRDGSMVLVGSRDPEGLVGAIHRARNLTP